MPAKKQRAHLAKARAKQVRTWALIYADFFSATKEGAIGVPLANEGSCSLVLSLIAVC
jgi:hypothetical protein